MKAVSRGLIFLLIVGNFINIFPAARYWSGTASTDANNTGNWGTTSGGTGASVPSSSDSVVFDVNSSKTCSLTTDVSWKNVYSTTGWTKPFKQNKRTLTTAGFQNWDGAAGSAFTFDTTVTVAGDGDFHAGSGIPTQTVTSCDLVLNGTGNLDLDLNAGFRCRDLTCATTNKTTTVTSAATVTSANGPTRHLNVGAGTLTLNAYLGIITASTGTETDPFVINSATTIGGNGSGFLYVYSTKGSGSLTINIPKLKIGGSAGLFMIKNGAAKMKWNITDSISVGGNFSSYTSAAADTAFLLTNGNYIKVGGVFQIGANVASSSYYSDFGSSRVDVGSIASTYSTGSLNKIILNTSSWLVNGNCNFGTLATIDAGTSLITFKKTSTFTPNTATFYDVKMDSSGQTLTSNSLICNTFNMNSGNVSFGGNPLKTTSDQTFSGSGTYSCSYDTMTGNGNFYMGSTVGTYTNTSGLIDLRGTGDFNIQKTGVTVTRLKMAYAGQTTTNKSVKLVSGDSLSLKGGNFIQSGDTIDVQQNSTADNWQPDNTVLSGNGLIALTNTNAGTGTYNIPSTIGSGNLKLLIRNKANTGTATFNQNGNLSAGSIFMHKEGSSGKTIYNSNNYSITTDSTRNSTGFDVGNVNALDSLKINLGSSTIKTADLDVDNSTGKIKIDFGSSNFTTMDDTFSLTNIIPVIGTANFSFRGPTVVATTGQNLNNVTVNAPKDSTVKLLDNMNCSSFSVIEGSVNQNGKSIISSGGISFAGSGNIALNGGDTLTGNGNFQITTSGTVTGTGGYLDMRGTGTLSITSAGVNIPTMKLAYPSKTVTSTSGAFSSDFLRISGGTYTCNGSAGWNVGRLILTPVSTINFKSGLTYTVNNYTTGDWSGTIGNVNRFNVNGSANASLNNPAGITPSYLSVTKNNALRFVDMTVGVGNVNGGENNANWYFGGVVPVVKKIYKRISRLNILFQ